MYSIIIYRAMTNPYLRLVRVVDALIWDVANSKLAMRPTYGDTDVQLTRDSTYLGGIPVTIPVLLPAGEYDALFYDGAVPAVTDEVVIGKRIQWNGEELLGMPQDL